MDEQRERDLSDETALQALDEYGETQAVFYRQQAVWVRPLLASFNLRPHQREDVLQQVMLTIWLRMPIRWRTARAAEDRQRWIVVVARNAAVDALRTNGRRPTSLPENFAVPSKESGEKATVLGLDRAEAFERLHTLMSEWKEKNPRNYRLLYGRFFENRQVKELVAMEGMSPHAVTNQLARLFDKFREQMKDLQDDADSS